MHVKTFCSIIISKRHNECTHPIKRKGKKKRYIFDACSTLTEYQMNDQKMQKICVNWERKKLFL